ncbi:bile acid:sodium symporter family protein [Bacteriovoracaceae bacterium]|nr:bile acid:sodium symporter family protein [Bacteriovoracaceae bacterium]
MNIVTQVMLPLILAFIMFSMGLDLTLTDFRRITKFPKAFLLGLVLQFISLPILAFSIAHLFIGYGLDPQYAVGLVIIAACPGGVTSNMLTHLVRGDSALSVSLTAVSSIISVITLPIIVNLALNQFMGQVETTVLPVGKTVLGIFLITTVPVAIGMGIKALKNEFATKIEPNIRKIASVLFILIISAAIFKDWKLIYDNFNTIGPATLALNMTVMLIAFVVARIFDLNLSQTSAITFECGLQNGTLAIFITLTLLNNSMMMLPGGIYSILMFGTAGLYIYLHKKSLMKKNSSIISA